MFAHNFVHEALKNADGSALRCRKTGKCKTWVTRPLDFRLPVKYGLRQSFYIECTTSLTLATLTGVSGQGTALPMGVWRYGNFREWSPAPGEALFSHSHATRKMIGVEALLMDQEKRSFVSGAVNEMLAGNLEAHLVLSDFFEERNNLLIAERLRTEFKARTLEQTMKK